MKIQTSLFAALLTVALAGCEPPAEQEEPDQPEPETEATMDRPADDTAGEIEANPEPAETETTTSEMRETEASGEEAEEPVEETDEPPPEE